MEIQTKVLLIIEIHHQEQEGGFRREGKMHIVVDVVEVQATVTVVPEEEEEAATLDQNILNERRIYLANVIVRIVGTGNLLMISTMRKIIKREKIAITENKMMVKTVKKNKFSNRHRQWLKIIHLRNIYLLKKVIDKVCSII